MVLYNKYNSVLLPKSEEEAGILNSQPKKHMRQTNLKEGRVLGQGTVSWFLDPALCNLRGKTLITDLSASAASSGIAILQPTPYQPPLKIL